jgi:hypothetical protein
VKKLRFEDLNFGDLFKANYGDQVWIKTRDMIYKDNGTKKMINAVIVEGEGKGSTQLFENECTVYAGWKENGIAKYFMENKLTKEELLKKIMKANADERYVLNINDFDIEGFIIKYSNLNGYHWEIEKKIIPKIVNSFHVNDYGYFRFFSDAKANLLEYLGYSRGEILKGIVED